MINEDQPPLDVLKEGAVRIRFAADLHERMVELDQAFSDLPERHLAYARSVISLARAAAAVLDEAIKVHRSTHAMLGDPQPPPRPKLQVVDGGPDAA